MTLSLARTKAALEAYDADEPRRDALWEAALTEADVWAAVEEENQAADKVREAFAEDTADRNSRDRAFLVSPGDPWLRRMVAKYGT